MAIESTEEPAGQRSNVIYSGPNVPSNWTAERSWFVSGGPMTDTQARNATPLDGQVIPQIGTSHPLNGLLKCTQLPVEALNGSPTCKRVRAIYTIPPNELLTPGNDPLLAPAQIIWRIGTISKQTDRDVDGNAITNSAALPFDQYPSLDVPVVSLTVTRNEPIFLAAKSIQYTGKTNLGSFTIASAGSVADDQCLCRGISSVSAQTGTESYVTVTYEFELREEGFHLELMDQGWQGYDTNGDYRPANQIGGQRCEQPILLNGTGQPYDDTHFEFGYLGSAAIGTPPGATVVDTGNAVFLKYKVRKQISFVGLV